jgi:hypothetical protein
VSDKELADAVVAHGVGEYLPVNHSHLDLPTGEWWHLDGVYTPTAEQFVRDWRVAGALMEKINWLDFIQAVINAGLGGKIEPRAITEACVKALKVMT